MQPSTLYMYHSSMLVSDAIDFDTCSDIAEHRIAVMCASYVPLLSVPIHAYSSDVSADCAFFALALSIIF